MTTRKTALVDRIFMGVCVVGVAFLMLQILTFRHGRDQGIYSVVARSILEGGMPYRDAWDFKPPGIFLVFVLARALFGSAQIGIRVLEVAGLAATIVGMTRLTEIHWGDRRIGLVSGAVLALAHAQLDFWHTAQPETFGGMLTIGALLLVASAERRDAAGDRRGAALWFAAAGFVFGVAGLLKPPLAGGGAVVGLALFARVIRGDRRAFGRALRPSLFIAAGGALPFVLCLAWFAARGALAQLREVLFVFTPYYTALGWVDVNPFGMLYFGFAEWFLSYCSVIPVGLLLLLGFRAEERERPFVTLLLGVVAKSVYQV